MGLQWAWAVEIAANLAVFPILGPEGLVGILSFMDKQGGQKLAGVHGSVTE